MANASALPTVLVAAALAHQAFAQVQEHNSRRVRRDAVLSQVRNSSKYKEIRCMSGVKHDSFLHSFSPSRNSVQRDGGDDPRHIDLD